MVFLLALHVHPSSEEDVEAAEEEASDAICATNTSAGSDNRFFRSGDFLESSTRTVTPALDSLS